MKILVITKNIRPDSGWGRYSLEVIKEYSNFKVESNVLTEDDCLLPSNSILNFIKNCIKVRESAKAVDVVHAFDGWPYGVYAWVSTLSLKKKFFINAIGTYSVAPLQDLFKGFLLKTAYKKANAVFPISDFIKAKILKYVELKNLQTVYLASSELPQITLSDIDKNKTLFSIRESSPVILTVGEIKDRKGQFEVSQSIKILKEKYPDILYLIVGSEKNNYSYVKKIRDFVSTEGLDNNVRIISNITSDKELSFFYTIADVFVLNARQDDRHMEGFGIVMLEAASFGKPVVGTRGTALVETMRDGFNGLLIAEQTAKDIADVVQKVLDKKEVFGENSRSFQKNFSWKKTVSEYVKYYEE